MSHEFSIDSFTRIWKTSAPYASRGRSTAERRGRPEVSEAQVRYYRDNTDLEVDAIIESYDGKGAALEIKLGHNQADQAAKNLLRLKAKMESAGAEPPSFLAVVEGLGQHAYVRDDGVCVIPITSLAP